MSTGNRCFGFSSFFPHSFRWENMRQRWEWRDFLPLRSHSIGSGENVSAPLEKKIFSNCSNSRSHNLGPLFRFSFSPELFILSYDLKMQLYSDSVLCTGTHLHFSYRCDGWIWAKDWSSVSRGCSCCQSIHCKAGMLRSGKVSTLFSSGSACSLAYKRRKKYYQKSAGIYIFLCFTTLLQSSCVSNSDAHLRNERAHVVV